MDPDTSERLSVPAQFVSMQQARALLAPVYDSLTGLVVNPEAGIPLLRRVVTNEQRRLHFRPWLDTWERVFTTFLATNIANMTPAHRIAAMTLKAHHLVADIFAKVRFVDNHLAWEAFNTSFRAILDLANGITTIVNAVPGSAAAADQILPGLSIASPVYEVLTRCTAPDLRQIARAFLTRLQPQQSYLNNLPATSQPDDWQ